MTLDSLIQILTNKITTLSSRKSDALMVGDLDSVVGIDSEIAETQSTLDRLKSLVS